MAGKGVGRVNTKIDGLQYEQPKCELRWEAGTKNLHRIFFAKICKIHLRGYNTERGSRLKDSTVANKYRMYTLAGRRRFSNLDRGSRWKIPYFYEQSLS